MVDMRILSTGRKKVRLAAFQVLKNLFVDIGVINYIICMVHVHELDAKCLFCCVL